MKIKEIRQLTNLSQQKFCEKYNIPIPTLRKWEQGNREPPGYVLELLEFKVRKDMEGYMPEKNIPMSMIDEMKDLKDALKAASTKNVEDMIKNLSETEKECLLRLYIYENK